MERLALITIILPFVGAFYCRFEQKTFLLKLPQYLLRLLRWAPC